MICKDPLSPASQGGVPACGKYEVGERTIAANGFDRESGLIGISSMKPSTKKLVIGAVTAALLSFAPAFAAENLPSTAPNSSPGVKGKPGNKSGPAVKPPGENGMGSTGANSGESGKMNPSTQPSQDSTGVKGKPGNKSGPTVKPNDRGTSQ
jgi:hypothetical protein